MINFLLTTTVRADVLSACQAGRKGKAAKLLFSNFNNHMLLLVVLIQSELMLLPDV